MLYFSSLLISNIHVSTWVILIYVPYIIREEKYGYSEEKTKGKGKKGKEERNEKKEKEKI